MSTREAETQRNRTNQNPNSPIQSEFQAAPIELANNIPMMPTTLRAASGDIIFGRRGWVVARAADEMRELRAELSERGRG